MAVMRHLYPNADARRVLQAHGQTVLRVIRVDPDSVLFLDADGHAQTAWIWRNPKTAKVNVVIEPGFAVRPPWDFT